jgi:hypothetical protein
MAGQETPAFCQILPRHSAPLTPEEEHTAQAILSRFQDPRDRGPKPAASVDPPSFPHNANDPTKRQINYFYVLARKAQIEHPNEWLQDLGLPQSPADCTMGQLLQVIERLKGEDRAPFAGRALRKKPQAAL